MANPVAVQIENWKRMVEREGRLIMMYELEAIARQGITGMRGHEKAVDLD